MNIIIPVTIGRIRNVRVTALIFVNNMTQNEKKVVSIFSEVVKALGKIPKVAFQVLTKIVKTSWLFSILVAVDFARMYLCCATFQYNLCPYSVY